MGDDLDTQIEKETDKIIACAKVFIPDLKVKPKSEASWDDGVWTRIVVWFQVLFMWVICKFTGQDDNTSCVVGNTIYLSDEASKVSTTAHIVIRHELVHLFDKKRYGALKFNLGYTFSSKLRFKYEVRAYSESLAARAWVHTKINCWFEQFNLTDLYFHLNKSADYYFKSLSGPIYLWAGRGREVHWPLRDNAVVLGLLENVKHPMDQYDMTSPYVLRDEFDYQFATDEDFESRQFDMYVNTVVERPYYKLWKNIESHSIDITEARKTWVEPLSVEQFDAFIQEGIDSGPSVTWDVESFLKAMKGRK